MARRTLREALPLRSEELAGIASSISWQLAELHRRGLVHGAITLDAITITDGRVELLGGTRSGTVEEDVAALGRAVAAAVTITSERRRRRDAGLAPLAVAAHMVRRAGSTGRCSAVDAAEQFAAAVSGARLPTRDAQDGPTSEGPRPRGYRERLAVAAWLAFLVAIAISAGRLGGGLSSPPLLDGSEAVRAWMSQRDVAVALFACVRLVVLALTWYLLATTAAAVGLRAVARGRAVRIADALLPTRVRVLVHAAIGTSVVVGAVTAAATGRVDTKVVDPARTPSPSTLANPDVRRDEQEAHRAYEPPAPVSVSVDVDAPATTPQEWSVSAGEHLWSIAAANLEREWDRSPTDAEITPYWRELIEANRARLVDRDNPDLLYPGQRMVLPRVPAGR